MFAAWMCGYWAVEYSTSPNGKPGHEWVAKQLTVGAWFFACVLIAAMTTAATIEIYSEPYKSSKSSKSSEVFDER